MNKFVKYELAILAKEKGFNEPCLASWIQRPDSIPKLMGCGAIWLDTDGLPNNTDYEDILCSAPLYQDIVDWFRTTHKISISAKLYADKDGGLYIPETLYPKFSHGVAWGNACLNENAMTYYQALNKAIEEAFKLI